MTGFVVDASVAATWMLADEQSAETDHLMERAGAEGAIAPLLFRYETTNILLMARRRGRFDVQTIDDLMSSLLDLPVDMDVASSDAILNEIYALAASHRLTAYDAAYLELAVRQDLPLATLAGDLRRAAAAEGVEVLP